jgi:hypothetical protein
MNGNKIIHGSTDSLVRERETERDFFQLPPSFSSTISHPSYFILLLFSDNLAMYTRLKCLLNSLHIQGVPKK